MSDQLYDEWDAACNKVREQEARIAELEAENQRLREIHGKAAAIVYNAMRLGWCDADREYLEDLLGGGE